MAVLKLPMILESLATGTLSQDDEGKAYKGELLLPAFYHYIPGMALAFLLILPTQRRVYLLIFFKSCIHLHERMITQYLLSYSIHGYFVGSKDLAHIPGEDASILGYIQNYLPLQSLS